jgi:uncharacterized protein (TIGR02996 family)
MPESEAFLKAICANPDDDGPRLIFTDWLEDNGDPERAEFIRVQCALEKLTENDPRYFTLWACEERLLNAHWPEWIVPICKVFGEPLPKVRSQKPFWHPSRWLSQPPTSQSGRRIQNYQLSLSSRDRYHSIYSETEIQSGIASVRRLQFHRGFIDHLDLYFLQSRMIDQLMDSFAVEPITSLNLTRSTVELICQLVEQRQFGQIRSLSLDVERPTLHAITNSPYCGGVERLSLGGKIANSYDLHPIRSISQSLHLRKLRVLDLYAFPVSLEEMALLIASPLIETLERLSISVSEISDETASLIAESIRFRESKCSLVIDYTMMSDEAHQILKRGLGDRFRMEREFGQFLT